MKGCRHKNVAARFWSPAYPRWYASAKSFVGDPCGDAHVCDDCGHWLPLGPSTDTPATAIEVRAAEIAVNVSEMTEWWLWVGRNTSQDENYGWRDWGGGGGGGGVKNWHAGYLARCIATHEDPTP